MREIGTSILMYAGDYDERLPTSWTKGFVGDPMFFVQPYMKSTQILLCPDRTVSVTDANAVCGPSANDGYGTWYLLPGERDNPTGEPYLWGYGFNNGASWNDGNGLVEGSTFSPSNGGASVTISAGGQSITDTVRSSIHNAVILAQVQAPSLCFMMADTGDIPYNSMEIATMRPVQPSDSPCEQLAHRNNPRHNGGDDYMYVDGHVKWIKYANGPWINTAESGSQPLNVPTNQFCSYYRKYDGSNDPGGCKELQNTEDDSI